MANFTVELRNFRLAEEASGEPGPAAAPTHPTAGAPDVTSSDPREINPSGSLYARVVVVRKAIIDSTEPAMIQELTASTASGDGRRVSATATWAHACIYVPGRFDDQGGIIREKKITEKHATVRLHWTRTNAQPDQWTRRAKDPDRGWLGAEPDAEIDLADALRVLGGKKDTPCTSIEDSEKYLETLVERGADVPTHQVTHCVCLGKRKFKMKLEIRVVPDGALGHEVVAAALSRALALLGEKTPRETYPKARGFYVELLQRLQLLVEAASAGAPDLKAAATGQLVPFADVMRSKTARLAYDRGADFRAVCRTTHEWSEYIAALLLHSENPPTKGAILKAAETCVFDVDRVAIGAEELDRCAPEITSLAEAAGLQEDASAAAQVVIDGVHQLPVEPPRLHATVVSGGGGAGTHTTAWRTARQALGQAADSMGSAVRDARSIASQAAPFVAPILALALKLYELSTQSDEMLQAGEELLMQIGLMVPVLCREEVRSMLLRNSALRGLLFAVFGAMERAKYVHDAFMQLGKGKRMLTVSSLRPELDKCAQDLARAQASLSQAVQLTAASDSVAKFKDLSAGQRALLRDAVERGEREERKSIEQEECALLIGTLLPNIRDALNQRFDMLARALQTLELLQPDERRRIIDEERETRATLAGETARSLAQIAQERERRRQRVLTARMMEADARRRQAERALDDQVRELGKQFFAMCEAEYNQAELAVACRVGADAISREQQQDAVLCALRIFHAQRYACMPFFMGELSPAAEKRLATFSDHYTPIAAKAVAGKDESRHSNVEAAWAECAAEAARQATASRTSSPLSPSLSAAPSPVTVRVFVESEAGSGKSTVVKWLAQNPDKLLRPGSEQGGGLGSVILVDLPTLLKRELEALDEDPDRGGARGLRMDQDPADDPDWPAVLVRSLADTSTMQAVPPKLASENEVSAVLRARAADVLYIFDGFDEVSSAINTSKSLGLLLRRLHGSSGMGWARNILVTSRPERAATIGSGLSQLLLFEGFARLRLLRWGVDAMTHYLKRFPWPQGVLSEADIGISGRLASGTGASVPRPSDEASKLPAAVAFNVLQSDSFGSALAGLPLMVHLVCCIVHPTAAWRHARRKRISDEESQRQLQALTSVSAMERLIDSVLEWQARKVVRAEFPDANAWEFEDKLDSRYPTLQQRREEILTLLRRRAYETTLHGGLISMNRHQFAEVEDTSLLVCVNQPKSDNCFTGQYRFLHKSMAEYMCACHILNELASDPLKVKAHFAFTTLREGAADVGDSSSAVPIGNSDRPRLGEAVVLLFLAELLLALPPEDRRITHVTDAVCAAMDDHLHQPANGSSLSHRWPTAKELADASRDEWFRVEEATHLAPFLTFHHTLGRRSSSAHGTAQDPHMNAILKRLLHASVRYLPEWAKQRVAANETWFLMLLFTAGAYATSLKCIRFAAVRGVATTSMVDRGGAVALERGERLGWPVLEYLQAEHAFSPSLSALLRFGGDQAMRLALRKNLVTVDTPSLLVALREAAFSLGQLPALEELVRHLKSASEESTGPGDEEKHESQQSTDDSDGAADDGPRWWVKKFLTYDFCIRAAVDRKTSSGFTQETSLDTAWLPELTQLCQSEKPFTFSSTSTKRAIHVSLASMGSHLRDIQDHFLTGCPVASVIFSPESQPESIGTNFLSGCAHLTTVQLPSLASVASIGPGFLEDCSSLTRLDMSAPAPALGEIGDNFLSGCQSLTELDLSGLNALEAVGNGFAHDCHSLEDANVTEEVRNAVAAALARLSSGDGVRSLCTVITRIVSSCRKRNGHLFAVPTVRDALVSAAQYATTPDVVLEVANTMCHITYGCDQLVINVFAKRAVRDALVSMAAHATTSDSVKWVATAIGNMASGDEQDNKDLFAKSGVSKALMSMVPNATTPDAVRWIAVAICNITEGDVQANRDRFARPEVVDQLVALARFAASSVVVEWLAGAISNITAGSSKKSKRPFATAEVRDMLQGIAVHAKTADAAQWIAVAITNITRGDEEGTRVFATEEMRQTLDRLWILATDSESAREAVRLCRDHMISD